MEKNNGFKYIIHFLVVDEDYHEILNQVVDEDYHEILNQVVDEDLN